MRKLAKNLKLTVAVTTMLVMFAVAPVVYGGISWSGIDPVFKVDGHRFNVYIEWPEHKTHFIDGLIDVDIWYPKGADVEFVSEAYDTFLYESEGKKELIKAFTKTNLKDGADSDPNQGGILVSAKVNTSKRIPVNVKVYHNGELVQFCEGYSDEFVFCDPYQFDDNDDDD